MKRKIEEELLFELVKNSKRSDRELAKLLGTSQPTITRRRGILVKEGKIKEFTVIVDWAKMGYEVSAFTFVNIRHDGELSKRPQEWIGKHHEIVFASEGLGMGMNGLIVSLHKDYASFADFLSSFRRECGYVLKDLASFTISLRSESSIIAKPFSFKHLR